MYLLLLTCSPQLLTQVGCLCDKQPCSGQRKTKQRKLSASLDAISKFVFEKVSLRGLIFNLNCGNYIHLNWWKNLKRVHNSILYWIKSGANGPSHVIHSDSSLNPTSMCRTFHYKVLPGNFISHLQQAQIYFIYLVIKDIMLLKLFVYVHCTQ
jgi:hypothetical protein